MGKVKQLWQDARDARWQSHYDQRRILGYSEDEASEYANDMMEMEDGPDA